MVDVPAKSDVPDPAPVMSEEWQKQTASFRKVTADDKVLQPVVPIGKNTATKEEKKADDGDPKDAAKVEEAKAKPAGESAEHGTDKADPEKVKAKALPAWMTERIDRSNTKAEAAEAKAKAADEARIAAEEALAVERAKKADPVKVAKKPDPDDFDTVAEYDDALIEWNAAKTKKAEPEKKPEPKKADEAKVPPLPPGVDESDITAAIAAVKKGVDADTIKALSELPVLPPMVILELADSDDKQGLATFVLGNPEIIEGIAQMKPRQQASALIRAFTEAEKPKGKKVSTAPEPIERVKGNAVALNGGLEGGFSAFEANRNKQELAQRRH